MQEKPVPEFMKRYMENIGYECFVDYGALSRQYHNEIAHYHEQVHPAKAQMAGLSNRTFGTRTNFDGRQELYAIDERYKEKAMEIGCKYGYRQPDEDHMYSREMEIEDFDLSPSDLRAKVAHSEFEHREGITLEDKQYERELIEPFYGDGHYKYNTPGAEEIEKVIEPEKEAPEQPHISRFEQKFNNFQMGKEDIVEPQPGSRFLSSLPSEKAKLKEPDEPGIKDVRQKFKDEGPEMCYDMR